MEKITSENFVENAMRTDCIITDALIFRLTDPDTIQMLHAAMGLCTEAGEFMDMLKKHIFAGKDLDCVNALEELGDGNWYEALAIVAIASKLNRIITLNDVLTMVINKLKLRYPIKFTEAECIDRDVVAEREFLEIASQYNLDATVERQNKTLSKRGLDWLEFAGNVLEHIEGYTVPQYGDKGNDISSEWSIEVLMEQVKKYCNRYGKNQRQGQELLDFMKAAHYTQIAYTKFMEGKNETN